MENTTTRHLKILHFNDVYNLEEHDKEPVGGGARYITALNELRDEDTLVLFSGDIFSPSQLSPVKKGKHMLPFIKHAKIDVTCLGNHDLDFGKVLFEKLAEHTNIPWLMSNIYEPDGEKGLWGCLDHMIIEHAGFKIGIIGLGEEEWLSCIIHLEPHDYIYEDYVTCARRWVQKFDEEGCDLKIALTHMRMPSDKRLADSVPELDLVLGGHDHTTAELNINDVLIVKSGCDFRELSKLDIIQTRDEDIFQKHQDAMVKCRRRGLIMKREQVLITKKFEPHPEMQECVDQLHKDINKKLRRPCGCTGVDLDGRFGVIRKEETNLGNLCADILRFYFKSDVCLINAGTIRTDDIIPAGILKYKDLENMLPMVEPYWEIRLTGAQLIECLECGVSGIPSLEGRFPWISGMRFEYDSSLEPMHRITRVWVGEEELNEAKLYTMATKDYLAKGKDGYNVLADCEMIKDHENCIDLKTAMIDMMQDMVKRNMDNEDIKEYVVEALKVVNNDTQEYVEKDYQDQQLRHRYFKIFPKKDGRIKDIYECNNTE